MLYSVPLLAAVGGLNYLIGWATSLQLFYLLPIACACWFGGARAGILITIFAAAVSASFNMIGYPSLPTTLWNAGLRLGLFMTFCLLFADLRSRRDGVRLIQSLARVVVISAAVASSLAAIGLVAQRQHGLARAVSGESNLNNVEAPTSVLAELASGVERCMRSSRPVLLGSRDPAGPSCVTVVRRGEIDRNPPLLPIDWDGGPGMTIAMLYFNDRQRCRSMADDFQWHQTRLRTYLENIVTENAAAQELTHELSEKASDFLQKLEGHSTWPDDAQVAELKPINFDNSNDWLRYCMTSLNKAAAAKDLSLAQHWAAELASAAFALDDLHRWLGFLAQNQLAALAFQAQCQSLFASADAKGVPFDFHTTISQFPAGLLSLNGIGNYYEVEHQAERLFSMPADRLEELRLNHHFTSNSVSVLPGVREVYLKLRDGLSPDNQKTWDLAARSPYEHGFLVNILMRASKAGMDDELSAALKRFDAMNPHASVQSLMDALMYRGHFFAGLEWSDRFEPRLVQAAARMGDGSDSDALRSACDWTFSFCQARASYGLTLTLRDALDQRRVDCIRATDMIGALYRDSGHANLGSARWCAETAGHAVAAQLGSADDSRTLLADGMNFPASKLEVWPDAYFHGHAWPAGFENSPTPYAVELYVRGLDSYIWAEGYIVRGPNAGNLVKAAVPYMPQRVKASSAKVFAGPYPE
jgi:hypothetical protein